MALNNPGRLVGFRFEKQDKCKKGKKGKIKVHKSKGAMKKMIIK